MASLVQSYFCTLVIKQICWFVWDFFLSFTPTAVLSVWQRVIRFLLQLFYPRNKLQHESLSISSPCLIKIHFNTYGRYNCILCTTSLHLIVKWIFKIHTHFSAFSTMAESQVLFNKASYGGAWISASRSSEIQNNHNHAVIFMNSAATVYSQVPN